ncbi:MAG: DM13 domain-containing protein [Actinomycetota bacterium]|nr:DM13 domain-containing protein [Actinomycetota bacterium]
MRRSLITCALAALTILALPVADGMAANVELLHGKVRAVGHSAGGRAAVVQMSGGRRVLTLRGFRIDPGPRVRVWLVPRSAKGDGNIPDDYRDLGRLKGNRGNQQYTIPASVDLRRYRSVIFWCVPFTQTLARADLARS